MLAPARRPLVAQSDGRALDNLREMRSAADEVRELYRDLELPVPSPSATDLYPSYKVKLLELLQPFSEGFRDADLRRALRLEGEAAIDTLGRHIISDAKTIAANRTIGSLKFPGRMRPIVRTVTGGDSVTDFYGNPLAWMRQFMPTVVTKIEAIAPQGQHLARRVPEYPVR
jgi:hypothetical protein